MMKLLSFVVVFFPIMFLRSVYKRYIYFAKNNSCVLYHELVAGFAITVVLVPVSLLSYKNPSGFSAEFCFPYLS